MKTRSPFSVLGSFPAKASRKLNESALNVRFVPPQRRQAWRFSLAYFTCGNTSIDCWHITFYRVLSYGDPAHALKHTLATMSAREGILTGD